MNAIEHKDSTVKHSYEEFSPQVSKTILEKKNNANRKIRRPVVDAYVADMIAHRWTECADPIVFNERGDLISGQHRLTAIVESGISQKFFVIRGFPAAAAVNIDTQLPRSFMDNAHFAGVTGVSTNLLGVVNAIEHGDWRPNATRQSMSIKLQLIDKHRAAASWALAALPRDKLAVKSLLPIAAVARAWYVEKDKAMLLSFCEVLKNGRYEKDFESTAVNLRNWLMANRHYASPMEWSQSFKRVQNAIWYYMRREPIKYIKGIADERYPLASQFTAF